MGPAEGPPEPHDIGGSFDEPSTAFQNALSITIDDPLHSADGERLVVRGHSHPDRRQPRA